MACKTSSTAKRRHTGGFTLFEAMVAMACGLLVLTAVCLLWGSACETLAGVFNYVDMANASKNALDRMSQQIRNARSVKLASSTSLLVTDLDGESATFSYDPTQQTLSQTKAGETIQLLKGCRSLSFSMYQPVPTSGSYVLAAQSGASTGKVVQVRWACGRFLFGSRTNTESQVSAKIVVRN